MEGNLSFFDYFKDIITIFTPIILAYLGFVTQRKEKDAKETRVIREKYERQQEEKRAEKEKKMTDDIKKIQNDIDEIKNVMNIEEVTKSLDKLVAMNTINMDYYQSLSHVVVKMGIAVKNTEIGQSDQLMKAIEDHLEKERELNNQIYKAIY